jgi:hypothetical protein
MAAFSSFEAVAMTAWLAREVQRTISTGRAVPAGLSGDQPNKAARQDLADLGNPLFRRALTGAGVKGAGWLARVAKVRCRRGGAPSGTDSHDFPREVLPKDRRGNRVVRARRRRKTQVRA